MKFVFRQFSFVYSDRIPMNFLLFIRSIMFSLLVAFHFVYFFATFVFFNVLPILFTQSSFLLNMDLKQ